MQLICIHCGSEKKELEFVPRSVTCIDCFNKFFLQIVAERVPTQEEITKAEQIQEKRRAYHREYAKNNRGKMSEIYTRYYHNNKQKILARRRTPKQKRKEKYYASMASHYLHDSYIAGLLGMKTKELQKFPHLLYAKRTQIQILREIKNQLL